MDRGTGLQTHLVRCNVRWPVTVVGQRLLGTTNVIESAFSISGDLNRRVKYWQGGEHVLRWVAMGLYDAESRFNKFATPDQMQDVIAALARGAQVAAA